MVLLHGFTGSTQAWGAAGAALVERGVGVHAVDLPGHGRHAGEVDPARFTLDATLRVVEESVAASAPMGLLGYSMGGRIALHYALSRPETVSRLVLEGASPGLADPVERAGRSASDDVLAGRLERWGIEAFVEHWEALPIFETQRALPPDVVTELRRRRLANDPASLAASLRGVGTGVLPPLWERLGEVSIPVLVVAGARDRKFAAIAERMTARLPDAELCIVEGAGHRVHLERPEAWAEAVRGFLAG